MATGFEIGSRVRDIEGFRATVKYIGPVAAAKTKTDIWLGEMPTVNTFPLFTVL